MLKGGAEVTILSSLFSMAIIRAYILMYCVNRVSCNRE